MGLRVEQQLVCIPADVRMRQLEICGCGIEDVYGWVGWRGCVPDVCMWDLSAPWPT